ncbi:MAG: hypothetical protein GY917_07580 [Planctomycetaceae bacterium]|jgi:hypothetical protein|nr:hypothetical protein [Planctomycetaceae bacterium]MCP4816317.1 hypothetical protein [Planctomycetaceae bacterium]MEC9002672.1 hypothetical protein [Planctomycetota bacterium]
MPERSSHQKKIIRNYYEQRDSIALQRAQELVTDLYLATGKARQRHWKNLGIHLEKLGLKPKQIEHLQAQDKPELVAQLVQRLLDKVE